LALSRQSAPKKELKILDFFKQTSSLSVAELLYKSSFHPFSPTNILVSWPFQFLKILRFWVVASDTAATTIFNWELEINFE